MPTTTNEKETQALKSVKDFKAFEAQFRKIKAQKKEKRVEGVGLMTPDLIRRHIKSGQDLVLAYGQKGLTVKYTVEDLRKFIQAQEKAGKEFVEDDQGVIILKLLSASDSKDRARAQGQIKTAVIYRVRGNVLHIQTNAGPDSKYKHHQVKVRLEDWYNQLRGQNDYKVAVHNAVNGRVSFDCDCGRHQFWYRYLATMGKFAIAPLEKDFPKIRNPKLTGCCCKHVIRALSNVRTPSAQAILVKEMERQSRAKGFADDEKTTRFLNQEELKKLTRSKAKIMDKTETEKAYQEYLKAQEAFKKKAADPAVQKAIKDAQQKIETLKAKADAQKARADKEKKARIDAEVQHAKDLLVSKLSASMDMAMLRRGQVPRKY